MIKRLIAASAVFSLALSANAVSAQDSKEQKELDEEIADEVEDQVAEAAVVKSYGPINYDVNEDRENILVLDLSNGKRIQLRLMPDWAPEHVARVKQLTRQGFYDGVIFHRVIDGFMAQTGDPTGTGQGGSELPDLKEEFNPMPHLRGSLSMARAQSEDSANSQFFIVFYPRFSLDKNYTNFGRVIAGMDGVDSIARGEPPANPTRIVQASIASDNRPVPSPTAPAIAGEAEITADALNAPIS